MRNAAIVIVFLLGLLAGGTTAGSDGLKIRSRLSQIQVVYQSGAIFVGRLAKTDHEYDEVEAYGRKQRFVTKYRALVRVQRILMGRKHLRKRLGRSPWLWIELETLGRPGKWRALRNHYASSFSLRSASPGDELIVYVPAAAGFWAVGEDHRVRVNHLDNLKYESRVKKLLRLVERLGDQVMRLPSRCLASKTFWWQGRCRTLAAVKEAIQCPANAAQQVSNPDAELEILCQTRAGKRHGMSYKWHENGELAERALYGQGLKHGALESFHDNGRRHCQSTFQLGKKHGRSLCWHPSGRLASTMTSAQGKPAGRSLILDADGRVKEGRCAWGKRVVWKTQSAWRARQWPCTRPGKTAPGQGGTQ